jgi:ABC-2 type transport system permease protein
VNWEQLKAFFWLRWRLHFNQMKRAGTASLVVSMIFVVGAIVAALGAFVFSLTAARGLLAAASAPVLMLVWDGVVIAFLFFWLVGLLAELQRTEHLALDKFLHLPISLTGAFLINYVGSFLSLCIIVFVPAMIGLSIALVSVRGSVMLLLFPAVAAFILMVTAVTYQFQGWLASLMANKRRRRTVIAFVTVAFMLLVQMPNLVNLTGARRSGADSSFTAMREELAEVERLRRTGQIDPDRYRRESANIAKKYEAVREQRSREQLENAERIARVANAVVPAGWLPFAVLTAAQGRVLPSILLTLGLVAIATASLMRSYRTTLRLYTGQFNSIASRPKQGAVLAESGKRASRPDTVTVGFLERQLPWLSEQASIIALTGFRSLTRAPESKMLLLTPLVMVLVFGSMFFRGSTDPPELLRPVMAAGAITMMFMSMTQLAGNLFGFDRSGFRAFVLGFADRKDVLLGKNLALSPLAFVLAILVVLLVGFVYPMRADHLIATVVQILPMYLTFCLISNFMSIFAPMPMSSGSLRPVRPKGVMTLIQIGYVIVLPVVLGWTLAPIGLEFLFNRMGWLTSFPVYLSCIVVEAVVVLLLYKVILRWQGNMLQRREQQILEVVTVKIE